MKNRIVTICIIGLGLAAHFSAPAATITWETTPANLSANDEEPTVLCWGASISVSVSVAELDVSCCDDSPKASLSLSLDGNDGPATGDTSSLGPVTGSTTAVVPEGSATITITATADDCGDGSTAHRYVQPCKVTGVTRDHSENNVWIGAAGTKLWWTVTTDPANHPECVTVTEGTQDTANLMKIWQPKDAPTTSQGVRGCAKTSGTTAPIHCGLYTVVWKVVSASVNPSKVCPINVSGGTEMFTLSYDTSPPKSGTHPPDLVATFAPSGMFDVNGIHAAEETAAPGEHTCTVTGGASSATTQVYILQYVTGAWTLTKDLAPLVTHPDPQSGVNQDGFWYQRVKCWESAGQTLIADCGSSAAASTSKNFDCNIGFAGEVGSSIKNKAETWAASLNLNGAVSWGASWTTTHTFDCPNEAGYSTKREWFVVREILQYSETVGGISVNGVGGWKTIGSAVLPDTKDYREWKKCCGQ